MSMKKNSASRFFGIAAAALAVLFCFVACDKKPIGGGGTILPPDDEDPHVIELYKSRGFYTVHHCHIP